MKKQNLLLLVIVAVGLFLRIFQLGINPPSMHADEADTGYTALSLLKTGRDPYGNKWPMHFQGQANNYKAPLYTYSVIPSVFFLGLSPASERLPSAIFGTLLILVVYYLLQIYLKSEVVSLSGAFLLSINPWAILLSRTGLEVQLCVLLVSLGILLFELGKTKKYYYYFSAIAFGLSLFAYHSGKVFTPLVIIALVLFNLRLVLKAKFQLAIFVVIFSFACSLIGFLALGGKGAVELNNVSIFDRQRAKEIVDFQRTLTRAPIPISSIFSNKPIYYIREFVNHFAGPLSLNYFFINGESNLDKGFSNYGQYHIFEFIPLIAGSYILWKKRKKLFFFLLVWILLGLVPGAITKTGYYAYRDSNMLVVPIILSSVGIGEALMYWKKYKKTILFYSSVSTVFLAYFIYNLFFAYPSYSRDWWGGSQRVALQFIHENRNSYKNIYVQGGMDWGVLYSFYFDVDPSEYQKSYLHPLSLGGTYVRRIGNIYIGDFIKSSVAINLTPALVDNSLLIVPGDYFKEEIPLKSFTSVDGVHIDLNAYEVHKK